MTDQKSPIEQALELVLYAPVGLALTAREELPNLIEKGRQRVAGQVMLARMIGQFAVAQGQHEVGKVARYAGDALTGLGLRPTDGPADTEPADTEPAGPTGAPEPFGSPSPSGPQAATGAPPAGPASPQAAASAAVPTPTVPTPAPVPPSSQGLTAPSSQGLAIPGYDSLSASQVVQRLAGLAPGELEAVRNYEATTRGRRTVLNRIVQLQTGAS